MSRRCLRWQLKWTTCHDKVDLYRVKLSSPMSESPLGIVLEYTIPWSMQGSMLRLMVGQWPNLCLGFVLFLNIAPPARYLSHTIEALTSLALTNIMASLPWWILYKRQNPTGRQKEELQPNTLSFKPWYIKCTSVSFPITNCCAVTLSHCYRANLGFLNVTY